MLECVEVVAAAEVPVAGEDLRHGVPARPLDHQASRPGISGDIDLCIGDAFWRSNCLAELQYGQPSFV